MADLALFPLQMPLFPTLSIDLQIFEQRYLRLVSSNMRSGGPFGVVAISDGEETGDTPAIYPVGTSATIQDWNQLDNGLLGITVRGGERFRVVSSRVEEDGLVRAEVEWLGEEAAYSVSEDYRELMDLLQDLARHPGAATFQIDPDTTDASRLGWQLAQVLPLSDDDKQALLAMQEPIERLEKLTDMVAELSQQ